MLRTILPSFLSLVSCLWAGDEAVPGRGPLQLSMKRAVELATSPEGNTNIQLADEAVRQAQARVKQARSAFLPNVDGTAGEQNVVQNLVAQGLTDFKLPLGIRLPSRVGPYNSVAIQATASELVDLSLIRRWQSAKTSVHASKSERDDADERIAGVVAKAYVAALRARANLEAVHADVTLAEALLKQAENEKNAGTGTGIDVTRNKVQVANERQRELVAQNEQNRTQFELLRTIGLRLDTSLEFTDKLEFLPMEPTTLEEAKAEAMKSRADLKAQQEKEDSARLSASAVRMEQLPSITAFGNYGSNGSGLDGVMLPTRAVGASLKIPVFDSGRRSGRRAEANSQYRQEKIRTADLMAQIELDLRESLDSMHSATEQLQVAKDGLALSENELAQAQRRYSAGVANGVEVTDAQTRLERARENQIDALFNYNVARVNLGQAEGILRRIIQ